MGQPWQPSNGLHWPFGYFAQNLMRLMIELSRIPQQSLMDFASLFCFLAFSTKVDLQNCLTAFADPYRPFLQMSI
jgi:hypothetical protein